MWDTRTAITSAISVGISNSDDVAVEHPCCDPCRARNEALVQLYCVDVYLLGKRLFLAPVSLIPGVAVLTRTTCQKDTVYHREMALPACGFHVVPLRGQVPV